MNPAGGNEIGSWDVVLLEDLTEDNLLSNLTQRYKWDQIYVSQTRSRKFRLFIIVFSLCLCPSRRTWAVT